MIESYGGVYIFFFEEDNSTFEQIHLVFVQANRLISFINEI